jgi:hypothetical protein
MLDERGALGPAGFEAAMRRQLQLFAQRQLSDAMAVGGAGSRAELVTMGTLKAMLREQECSFSISFFLYLFISFSVERDSLSLPLSL